MFFVSWCWGINANWSWINSELALDYPKISMQHLLHTLRRIGSRNQLDRPQYSPSSVRQKSKQKRRYSFDQWIQSPGPDKVRV